VERWRMRALRKSAGSHRGSLAADRGCEGEELARTDASDPPISLLRFAACSDFRIPTLLVGHPLAGARVAALHTGRVRLIDDRPCVRAGSPQLLRRNEVRTSRAPFSAKAANFAGCNAFHYRDQLRRCFIILCAARALNDPQNAVGQPSLWISPSR
jgi:hypothetical protein